MDNSNPDVKNFGLIGAGPVGIFLSFLLIEKGYKVTLYEAGSRDSESTNLNLSNYVFKTKSKMPGSQSLQAPAPATVVEHDEHKNLSDSPVRFAEVHATTIAKSQTQKSQKTHPRQ